MSASDFDSLVHAAVITKHKHSHATKIGATPRPPDPEAKSLTASGLVEHLRGKSLPRT